jgi:ornithine cyclodeaminase/alanine dehydrogenase-like protein (mu-crystallin family)
LGSGKQAFTQVLGVAAVTSLVEVRVWSRRVPGREAFAGKLEDHGFVARAFDSPGETLEGADVASAITSSQDPFLDSKMASSLSHLNLCGGNDPALAEITTDAVASFDTVVDDLPRPRLNTATCFWLPRTGTSAGTAHWNFAGWSQGKLVRDEGPCSNPGESLWRTWLLQASSMKAQ